MPPPPAPTTTDPSGQLSTYLCLLKEAHMLGKTHVGNMRVGGGHMQERVMQMTDEVLSAARNAARDLEILQEAYVSSFLKQRGELPTFKGAWGNMHVFRALYHQLRAEVDAQLRARQSAAHHHHGRPPPSTVAQKRVAWNDLVTVQWQEALRENDESDAKEWRRQREAVQREHAAAAMIQGVWQARKRRKGVIRKVHLQMRKAATKLLASSAFAIVAESNRLAIREHNKERREMGLSVAEWEEVQAGTTSVAMAVRKRKKVQS
eukprot:CAMPEP_0177751400 /NCGR_PEP_ID=MMETSP0491_2-20121128/352_1 /TAXON_ID=63592 /ORGANISM="Tetraselmis chuii, Strain PLY429" /LENGTH=262 /DNA_ID=CAMNT_0019266507 /DNA_START=227 /DNA_END=1012 /DNA_ORIENTATION=+